MNRKVCESQLLQKLDKELFELVKGIDILEAIAPQNFQLAKKDRKSTRLNSSHSQQSRMPSSA